MRLKLIYILLFLSVILLPGCKGNEDETKSVLSQSSAEKVLQEPAEEAHQEPTEEVVQEAYTDMVELHLQKTPLSPHFPMTFPLNRYIMATIK